MYFKEHCGGAGEGNPQIVENFCKLYSWWGGLVSGICKEFLQLNNKKTTPLNTGQRMSRELRYKNEQ